MGWVHTRGVRIAVALCLTAVLLGFPVPPVPADPPDPTDRADPVAGPQTAGDSLFPNVGNGGYDVDHYDLALDYDGESGSIAAIATIEAHTTGADLSSFSLDFKGLAITELTVNGGEAPFTRENSAARTKHKLVVSPYEPVSGAFTVEVTYSGTPVSHTDPDGSSEGWNETSDGVVFLNEPIGAMTLFPSNNTPQDKATFRVSVTAPTELKVASNGELDDVAVNGDGTSTWTWVQQEQQATYLTMLAVDSFVRTDDVVELTDGRSIPEWSFHAPGTDPRSERLKIPRILRALEKRYGRYPGRSTGLVVDRVPSGINYALETQDRPFFPFSVDQATLIHELAHQWFGNAVSPADWSDVWLNEGPATWLEVSLTHDLFGGPSSYRTFHDDWATTRGSSPLWKTPVAGFDDPAKLFDWQVYSRGAMALEALRTRIGTQSFHRVLRQWIARRSGGDATTADFVAVAQEVSDENLRRFFQDWLYDRDKPIWPLRTQRLTPRPRILGEPEVGKSLRAAPGRHDRGVTVTYRWLANDRPIPGASQRTLLLTRAEIGANISVRTTAKRAGYRPVVRTSTSRGPVTR